MRVLVTGGAGFVGSAPVHLVAEEASVFVVEKHPYSGNLATVAEGALLGKYAFLKGETLDAGR